MSLVDVRGCGAGAACQGAGSARVPGKGLCETPSAEREAGLEPSEQIMFELGCLLVTLQQVFVYSDAQPFGDKWFGNTFCRLVALLTFLTLPLGRVGGTIYLFFLLWLVLLMPSPVIHRQTQDQASVLKNLITFFSISR